MLAYGCIILFSLTQLIWPYFPKTLALHFTTSAKTYKTCGDQASVSLAVSLPLCLDQTLDWPIWGQQCVLYFMCRRSEEWVATLDRERCWHHYLACWKYNLPTHKVQRLPLICLLKPTIAEITHYFTICTAIWHFYQTIAIQGTQIGMRVAK